MTWSDEEREERFGRLPREAAGPLRQALAHYARVPTDTPKVEPPQYTNLVVEAAPLAPHEAGALVRKSLEAVSFRGHRELVPLPSELTDAQRAVVELLAYVDGAAVHRFAIPPSARVRRRWLGIDPPTRLEQPARYVVAGETREAPLWRALAELTREAEQMSPEERAAQTWDPELGSDTDPAQVFFLSLPIEDRLEVLPDLLIRAYRLNQAPRWGRLSEIDASHGRWAVRVIEEFVQTLFAEDANRGERAGYFKLPAPLKWPLFLALARGGVPIEPAWESLLPAGAHDPYGPAMRECIRAIDPERRAPAILTTLRGEFPRGALAIADMLLDEFPYIELVDLMLENIDASVFSIFRGSRRGKLAHLADRVAERPALAAHVAAHIDALPDLPKLTCRRRFRPRSLSELTDAQRAQLEVANGGAAMGVGAMPLPETPGAEDEESFVSVFEIVDENDEPVIDAILLLDEDGSIFRAGTTERIGWASQMRLQMDDPALQEAVQMILCVRP